MNEFYEVIFYGGDTFFFHNKDNAFAFLRQEFFRNLKGKESTNYIKDALTQLNEFYEIDGFGEVRVVGFED